MNFLCRRGIHISRTYYDLRDFQVNGRFVIFCNQCNKNKIWIKKEGRYKWVTSKKMIQEIANSNK